MDDVRDAFIVVEWVKSETRLLLWDELSQRQAVAYCRMCGEA